MTAHAASGGSPSGTSVREEALVARLAVLDPALDGEPDPAWQARTRDRLVAMAAVRAPEPAPLPVLRRRSRAARKRGAWRTRLTAGLAGAAAAVTGLAGVVALSADARPGDVLYGIKRGAEQTQLALAGDARGRTLLTFATTRLEELAAVLEDDPPTALVEGTLATMDTQTADGVAELTRRAVDAGAGASLDDLASWAASQSTALGGLLPDVPSGALPEAAASADLLDRVDGRVAELRTSLGCAGGPVTDGADDLGPRAAACGPAADPPAAGGGRGAPDAVDEPAPSSRAVAPSAPSAGGAEPPADLPALDRPPPDQLAPGLPAPDVAPPRLPAPGVPVPGLPAPRLPVPDVPAPRLPAQDLPVPRTPALPLPAQEPPALPDPGADAPPPLGGPRLPAPPADHRELTCGLTQVVTDC